MNTIRLAAFLAAALSLCAAASAQADKAADQAAPETKSAPVQTPPAAEAPQADETPAVKAADKAASGPEEKPAEKPAAKAEEKPAEQKEAAKPADEKAAAERPSKPADKPAEAPLNAGAARYAALAEGYQKAHDDFLTWLKGASATLDKVESRIADSKKSIEANSAQITKLQLEQTSAADHQARDLKDKNDQLWRALKSDQRRQEELVRALGRAARQKVRDINKALSDQADALERR